MEGAKSTGRAVPPTGVGNLELMVGWMGIGKSDPVSVHIYETNHAAA